MSTHHTTSRTDHIEAARKLGREHARNVASWAADGNSDPEHIRRVLRMLDDGDAAAWDYLPEPPNLSGEWADGLTPAKLLDELDVPVGADDAARDELVDAICNAYEEGVSEAFGPACEEELRRWVD